MKRKVAESYIVDYNPFMLEAMQSNMELSLVVYTPWKVLEYITKEQQEAFGMKRSLDQLKHEDKDPSIENVLNLIDTARKLSLSEAFYRIDSSLYLTETNMTAFAVEADLPNRRLFRLIPDINGRMFEGLQG